MKQQNNKIKESLDVIKKLDGVSMKKVQLFISPQKLNAVASIVRNKRLDEAIKILSFMPNKGAFLLNKLCKGAFATLKYKKFIINDFFIYRLEVNKGPVLKRTETRAKGVSNRISKRFSYINLSIRRVAEIYPSGLRG